MRFFVINVLLVFVAVDYEFRSSSTWMYSFQSA